MTSKLSPVGTLLLLRLALVAPEGKPLAAATARKEIAAVLPDVATEQSLADAREELVAAGLAEVFIPPAKATKSKKPKPPPEPDPSVVTITPAGRSHALAILRVEGLPAKATFKSLIGSFILPQAMGLPAGAKMPTPAKLVSTLLARKTGLPANATNAKLLEAIACRELGFADVTTLAEVRTAALNRLLSRTTGQEVKLAGKDLEAQVPLAVLGMTRASPEAIKTKLLQDWLGQAPAASPTPQQPATPTPAPAPTTSPSPSPSFDLPAFARQAVAAARAVPPAGWFGQNKVYINHAYRQFVRSNPSHRLDLPQFKERLIEAHRASLLVLSRADLIAAMNLADVNESEARYLNAEFHFILLEGGAA